jgi:glycosyltransferase involved in cell wall biosynthesis
MTNSSRPPARSVSSAGSRPLPDLAAVVREIERGEPVPAPDLLRFLATPSESGRAEANLRLARGYFGRYEATGDNNDLRWAQSCVERAWNLSHHAQRVLPLYLEINRAAGDLASIKDSIKRAGLDQAARGDLAGALASFDRWAYADSEFLGRDLHSYDPEILDCVEALGGLHRFEHERDLGPRGDRPLRVAHLMQGLTENNSVLAAIDRTFARHYDRSRVAVAYFATETGSTVAASKYAGKTVAAIDRSGWPLIVAPDEGVLQQELLGLATAIHEFRPDVLVTGAALATFKNYFVAALRPAPVTVAFQQGPSPQFTWHTLDHSIAWFRTNIIDCPTDCSHVPLELDLPEREALTPIPRCALNVPTDATIVASGGRSVKFSDLSFWHAVDALLRKHRDLHWVFIGFSEADAPSHALGSDVATRVRFLGWRSDYLEILAAADLVVDSYPVGGGVFLIEAMALGLPVLSFNHDYILTFSNDDCSGARELLEDSELILERGNFEGLADAVSKFVHDPGYRRRTGEACRQHVIRTRSDPSRMVRRCVEIYETVFDDRVLRAATEASRSAPRVPPDAQAGFLRERTAALDRREAALNRREAAQLLRRIDRTVHRAWITLRKRS